MRLRRPSPSCPRIARSAVALAVGVFSACTWVDPRAIGRFACDDGGCPPPDGGTHDGGGDGGDDGGMTGDAGVGDAGTGDGGSFAPDAGSNDGGDAGPCAASSLVATGILQTSGGNVDYTGTPVEVEVTHRFDDINPIEDGCIGRMALTLRLPGGGCTLQLLFDAFDGTSSGLVQARFVADSACPGLPDGGAGTYDSELGYGPSWYSGPRSVGQRRATSACLPNTTLSFPETVFHLWREVPTPASLAVDLSGLVLTGDLLSQGHEMVSCGDTSRCASAYHPGGNGWCVPVGACSRNYHDNGAGTCVDAGCAPGYAYCGGSDCLPESATSCGAGCAVCPEPPSSGFATCSAGVCAIECGGGFVPCSGDCVRLSTTANCGACGVACGAADRCHDGGCADTEWTLWPIPVDPKGDALYQSATDTVTDVVTGLTWQRAVPPSALSRDDARDYCAGLGLADGSWRLPTLVELESLVDLTRSSSAGVNPTAFPSTPTSFFWSSTPYVFNVSYGWAVFFGNGPSSFQLATSAYRVRCVR